MPKKRRFAFIFNPYAGRGRAMKLENVLYDHLRRSGLTYDILKTTERFHAASLARQATRNYDLIVAVGGDGTVHEVVNGIVGTKALMSVLPLGSGNDFGRLLRMPDSVEKSIEAIKNGITKKLDVGRVTATSISRSSIKSKYFVNSLGAGLDAAIAQEAQTIKWLKGIPLYLAATLRTLVAYKAQRFTVSWDSRRMSSEMLLVCVGNGDREGGGFRVTPNAHPDDQKFQVCLVENLPILTSLRVIPLVMKGQHAGSPGIHLMDAKKVTIRSDLPFVVHADGEILGSDITEVKVELQPQKLRVVVPRLR